MQALADRMIAAVHGAIARAVDPIGQRLSRIELIAGTMAMMRGTADEGVVMKHVERIEALQARLDESAAIIASLEHRLSRHGERLAQLEAPWRE